MTNNNYEIRLRQAKDKVTKAKEAREYYAEKMFDTRGKFRDNVSPNIRKIYHYKHKLLMQAQKELHALFVEDRIWQNTNLCKQRGFTIGSIYYLPDTQKSGVLKFDKHGYLILEYPISSPLQFAQSSLVFEHTLEKLQELG
jgi:hypothetical protein